MDDKERLIPLSEIPKGTREAIDVDVGAEWPGYEKVHAYIGQAAMTMLPGLLTECIRQCVKKGVFIEGGLEVFVKGRLVEFEAEGGPAP